MSDEPDQPGQRAAAEYLRQLLLKPGPYRDEWRQHVGRPRDGIINQLAVAEVLAGYLHAAPRGTGDADIAAYQLRDTVAQALAGRQLSRPSLQLFIGAFGLTPDDAARAWRLWNGAPTIRVLAGTRGLPATTEDDVARALGPRRHQTLSLHDHVWVAADGRIDRHHVIQVVEAACDGVDRIPFAGDTSVLTLEVGQGCRDVTGRVREIGGGVFVTEIRLARTLAAGETTTLEYWVTWRVDGNLDNPAEREYRRAVMSRLESYELRVEFHPAKLPQDVWWAQWEGIDGDVVTRERVSPDSQRSVQRYLQSLEKTVAACWNWPQG